jgi:hypothetical protein
LPDLHEMLDAATESPATADAPSGAATDDLLSQLAGKEIDRLLADAGVEPAQETPGNDAAAAPVAVPAVSADSTTLSPAVSAAAEAQASSVKTEAASVADAKPADVSAGLLEKELDQIVAQQLSEAIPSAPAAERPAAAPTPDEASPSAISNAVPDLLDRLEAGERAPAPAATPAEPPKEKEVVPPPATAESEPQLAATSEADDSDEIALPESSPAEPALVGRVLDWVTLPLDPFPAPIRDVIGKIAIVTTINAAAVLAYVTFFRK